jgi:exosome complex RNA-binding protein Csl4
MHQDQWMEEGVREALMPGDVVRARVFKVRTIISRGPQN